MVIVLSRVSTNGAIETYFSKHHSGVSIRRNNIDPVVWEHSKMMYERYVMNKDKLLKLIKSQYQTTAKKISVVEGEIKEIGVKNSNEQRRATFLVVYQRRKQNN